MKPMKRMKRTPMSTKRVLQNAIVLLETAGWCQHVGKDKDGQYCAVGAINHVLRRATKPMDKYDDARDTVQTAIRAHKFRQSGVVSWNDTKGRTKAQVLNVFRTAIQLAG